MRRQFIVFRVEEQRFALNLALVERVVRTVAITPLPQAPASMAGIINVQGKVVPVISMRRCFHLPERATELSDQLIIVHMEQRSVALMVDATLNVLHLPEQLLVAAADILPDADYVDGVVKCQDGMVLILDLQALLSSDEKASLIQAMAAD